ncbi:MAG: hypothetical protein ACE5GM_11320, partial [bacterium]
EMNKMVYHFGFKDTVSLLDIEESLFLSVLAVECLHGRSRIRMDAMFKLDKKTRICVVDAGTEVGCHIARIFNGFLAREFGEEAFKVERRGDMPAADEPSSKERRTERE